MKPIFLIGYMGSGKTTVGQNIARIMHLEFIDLDEYIEKKNGKTIPEIFAESGEEVFRELERVALHEVAAMSNCVIATGGGSPCFFNNMELMKASGTTIYLEVGEEELAHRLFYKGNKRPLVQGRDKDDLRNYIHNTLVQRNVYYRKAALTMLADDTNATIGRLIQLLG